MAIGSFGFDNNNGGFNNGGFGGNNGFSNGFNNGGFAQPVQQPQLQQFNYNKNADVERLYRDVLATIFVNKLSEESTDEGLSFSVQNRNIITLRGSDLALTFDLEMDKKYRALQVFVSSSFGSNFDAGEVVDDHYLNKNAVLKSLLNAQLQKYQNLHNITTGNVSLFLKSLMDDISKFGNAVGEYINNNIQVDNMGNLLVTPQLQALLRSGFSYGGIKIVPIINRGGIEFNYTIDEILTNMLKRDQAYFTE